MVVLVLHQHDLVAPYPLLEAEGPGADRRTLERVHRLARIDDRALAGQVEQEVGVERLEREGDGVVVLDDDVADRLVVARIRMLGLGVHRPLEDVLHVGGLQLAAVVEVHALLHEEGVVAIVGGVPALGQPRRDLAVPVYLHQTLLDVVEDDARGGRRRRRGQIETGRLGGGLHDEVLGSLRAGRSRDHGEGEHRAQHGQDRSARHGDLLK